MNDLDREIEKALSAEDKELTKHFQELGLFGQFKTLFQGPTAWVSTLSLIAGTLVTGLFFYTCWQFFIAEDASERLLWGGGAMFICVWLGFMKMWMFMRMEGNRVVREIKRLELQLARKG